MSRLRMEIKTMQKLDHPNILKLIDVIDSPENLYIVLEYCACGEYFDFISKHEKVFINNDMNF
jgi:MAP/microtubule affinity-regulating kinase